MNNFKESLKVEREKSGEIIMTEPLQNLLIELMKGNISKKEVMEMTGIGDKGTVELKIKEMVAQNPGLKPIYNEYMEGKRENFEGYAFRAEAIEMLREDYSQTTMAKKIGVTRRSFSAKIKQLQEENSDNILGILLKQHAERKLRKTTISVEDLLIINLSLDEYEEQYPVGTARYEKRTSQEIRKENLTKVVSLIDKLRQDGITLKELSEKRIISEANYRRYRLELDALSKLLDDKEEKEQ